MFGTVEQFKCEGGEAFTADSLTAIFLADIDAFEIDHFVGFGNYVGLEDQLVTFGHDEYAILFDSAGDSLEKAFAIL